jgi:CarD family transcriptional regulator
LFEQHAFFIEKENQAMFQVGDLIIYSGEGVCRERAPRLLNEHYQALMQSHQCEDLVQIVKAVYLKQQEDRAKGRKIAQVDERYMKRAEDMLHGELAVALGIARSEVPQYIADALHALGA